MRTTLSLDDDVVAEVERLRREEGLGLSEAVNKLARRGIASRQKRSNVQLPSWPLGAKVDLTNVADVLDLLDDADGRRTAW